MVKFDDVCNACESWATRPQIKAALAKNAGYVDSGVQKVHLKKALAKLDKHPKKDMWRAPKSRKNTEAQKAKVAARKARVAAKKQAAKDRKAAKKAASKAKKASKKKTVKKATKKPVKKTVKKATKKVVKKAAKKTVAKKK